MRRKKMYRLYAEDIKNLHTFLIKKLPPLPTFDSEQTEDELISLQSISGRISSWNYDIIKIFLWTFSHT